MKIYLDDIRNPPSGWDLVKTADACIAKLETGNVEELSLDHDLAEEHYDEKNWEYIDMHGYTGTMDRANYREKTGYSVVQWMIQNNVWPKLVVVHSMNPVGRASMVQAVDRHKPSGVLLDVRPGWCR